MKTAVLIILFNRPDFFLKIINVLKIVKPQKIYLSIDGPRKNNHFDKKKIKENIKLFKKIDWKTKVKIKINKYNKNSKNHPISAINWIFKTENKAIILEDDCIPSISFFNFCEILLKRFKNNKKISMISGRNNLENSYHKKSYYFTFGSTWGWATWKRAWKHNDPNLKKWHKIEYKNSFNKNLSNYPLFKEMLFKRFQDILGGKLKTAWDFQWFFSTISRNMIGVVPTLNLIKNIGFDSRSSHTKKSDLLRRIKNYELGFPLKHNNCIKIDDKLLLMEYNKIYSPSLINESKKIIYKFVKIFFQR
jgi:hypothetical protein